MTAPPAPILELEDVSKIFGNTGPGGNGTVAVDRVSLRLDEQPPRIISIVGESGSGKTTVARALLGLAPVTEGTARYRGKDIATLSKEEMRTFRREVQAVFQDPYGIYNPFYRVNRVFDLAIKKFELAKTGADKTRLIEEALRAVNLRPPDVLGRYPHQLSGGERQRIMLARAYLLRPKVIVADEAISMLDVAVRATIMNILIDFHERSGVSTVFITHDLSAAYYLGGDIMVMARGRVVEEGRVRDVLQAPAHPYSRLLLDSIPSPDPDERWGVAPVEDRQVVPELLRRRDRCLFAERCPHTEARCWRERPAMRPVDAEGEGGAGAAVGPAQQAACILYPKAEAQRGGLLPEAERSLTPYPLSTAVERGVR